jgi:hypothetical protein
MFQQSDQHLIINVDVTHFQYHPLLQFRFDPKVKIYLENKIVTIPKDLDSPRFHLNTLCYLLET